MVKQILGYGTIAGVFAGGVMFAMSMAISTGGIPSYATVIGYVTMLIALSAVFAGIKRHRDRELGGVIGFWPAFGMGVGISVVAGVFYVLAWEASVAINKMDFAAVYADYLMQEEKAKGASAEALAKLGKEMEEFRVQYANPLFRMPMTFLEIFPVGLLVSLVSAGLLRNRGFLPARRAPA